MNPIQYNYTALETVVANQSVHSVLPNLLDKLKKERVFIVSSNTLNQKTDVVESIQNMLGNKIVGVFDSIRSHTPRSDVLKAAKIAKQLKADCLLAIGGGSIIDAAKAIQVILNVNIQTEEQLIDYAQFSNGKRGVKAKDLAAGLVAHSETVRVIAVPTTLSGAEFSNNAGVLNETDGSKEGYRMPKLYPQAIVYDPEIVIHTPDWLWLSTAVRSIDHAIEGYCSSQSYPYLEGQFLHSLKLFADSLRNTKKNPNDVSARAQSQQAVWLACCALGRISHGASHGIGYILGSLCGVPHGYTSCVMLPAVLEWNRSVNGDRDKEIAKALGNEKVFASEALKQLIVELELPSNLQHVGVKKEQLPDIARRAAENTVVKTNPKPVNSDDDVLEILQLAWD